MPEVVILRALMPEVKKTEAWMCLVFGQLAVKLHQPLPNRSAVVRLPRRRVSCRPAVILTAIGRHAAGPAPRHLCVVGQHTAHRGAAGAAVVVRTITRTNPRLPSPRTTWYLSTRHRCLTPGPVASVSTRGPRAAQPCSPPPTETRTASPTTTPRGPPVSGPSPNAAPIDTPVAESVTTVDIHVAVHAPPVAKSPCVAPPVTT